jgi:threonine/homoserine/homoserine lactone efflux protein
MSVITVFPPGELFVPFLVAGLALNLVPGSDMTFVALCAARGGRNAGLAAAGGIFAGCLVHILFAVVGLSALIVASQTAFEVVKWLGVAYLVYMAIQLLFEDSHSSGTADHGSTLGPTIAFRKAAIVNILNPKVGIFFLAFLPQFIEPQTPYPWVQILALGMVFNMTGVVVNGLVALLSSAAFNRVAKKKGLRRFARWISASIIGALATKLALSRNE